MAKSVGLFPRIFCVGEVLTDVFPSRDQPGGALANVAFHLASSGGVVASLCSRVGDDERGRGLRDYLAEAGVDVSLVQVDPSTPSGLVKVQACKQGPAYEICFPSAWDFIEANDAVRAAVRNASIVVFGTLAQRYPVSRTSVRLLVDEARATGVLRFADLNLRDPFFDPEVVLWILRNADVVKLNTDELRVVSAMLGAHGDDNELFGGLVREFGIGRAVLTAGAIGAWIHENGILTHIPPHPAEVADVVGAGDAFAAMLICGLAKGSSLLDSAPRAARLASWIVSSTGATPSWTPELRRELGD